MRRFRRAAEMPIAASNARWAEQASTRAWTPGTVVAALGAGHAHAAAICGKSSDVSISPSHSTTARKTVFSSWRTLPGQIRASSSSSASGVKPETVPFSSALKRVDEVLRQRRDVLAAARARAARRWETR